MTSVEDTTAPPSTAPAPIAPSSYRGVASVIAKSGDSDSQVLAFMTRSHLARQPDAAVDQRESGHDVGT